jgi:hypothetical protein
MHCRKDHRSEMWRNLEKGDPARNVGYPPQLHENARRKRVVDRMGNSLLYRLH